MSGPRAVLDTNILVAAFLSKRGASYEVFRRLRQGDWTAVLSNHLLFEYEEVLKRDSGKLGMTLEEVDEILNAVSARGEEWPLKYGWEPVLSDPDDEPLVQLAFESGAMHIISHKLRHLRPATDLGIQVLIPGDFLRMLAEQT
jgi:putative PIN family toxin of toxin-antitoxin system